MRGKRKDDIHSFKYSELAILQGSFSETCQGFFKSGINSIGWISVLRLPDRKPFFIKGQKHII